MVEETSDIEQEYRIVHRQYVYLLAAALVMILGGAVVYRNLMDLSWVDAFYFCTTTLATVGYGDITPTTDAAKIFTIFYILFGIGVFAAFANLLVKNASLRRELRRTKRKHRSA